jgi:phosphopantetheine adenylyltransferase
MRFKDYLKLEAVIDIPRKGYAPSVFDNANTDSPKMKSKIIGQIMKQFTEFKKEYPILDYSLIGSILTKRYRDDADLDINVLFDVPKEKQEEERTRLSKLFLSTKNADNIQGKLIPGTNHPINYYFITDKATYDDQNKKADAVFDIGKNKFIKRPEDFTFDPGLYVSDFNKKVQEIDVIKGELKRDIIDYKELKGLSANDVLDLQEKIKDKLEEIEDDIELIIKVGDDIDAERRKAFDTDMSPEEIRQYGIKNRLPKAVIYKMLEKYHYITFYKYCKKILDDGVVTDKEIENMPEAVATREIAFTFGRFNPPTVGHEKLIKKVASVSSAFKIFLSRSEDKKKNPLSPRTKLTHMKFMFPKYSRNIEISNTNMILDIASKLHKQGYTAIKMVVGSDRVREFENILKKYNGERNRHGFYDFETIKVISAGERDPDAEGVSGMSASKMRDAASKDDYNTFKKGVPTGYRNADDLFKDVRKGMRLADNYSYETNYRPIKSLQEFEQNQIRDLYIREMIYNIGDQVNYIKEDINGKVIRKGTNYIVLEDNNNNLHKAWIWDCLPNPADREAQVREHNLDVDYGFTAVSTKEDMDRLPQDKDVKKKDGTQPKKYYKDMSKDTKSKRADHFKKTDTTKNDNDPAPGDKDAKTKPSTHTKKFKQMYGETKKESYDIGHDYAKHAVSVTPGQDGYDPNYQGGAYKPAVDGTSGEKVVQRPISDDISVKDINDWATTSETIDKYKERYKEEWQRKLSEVVSKMIRNI